MISWQIVYRAPQVAIDSSIFKVLAWTGSISMGIWASFLIFSLPFDLIHLSWFGIQKLISPFETDLIRRDFLLTWIPTGALGVAGASTSFGLFEAFSGPKLTEITVPIANLPPSLEGLKIAQISDLHIGPTIRREFVERVVNQVLSAQPDIIAVTGDLIDGVPHRLTEHIAPLAKLKAPLGTYYVTGNHEYYWGAENWIRSLEKLGFTPLLNENRVIHHQGSKLLLAGVTDSSAHDFIPDHLSDPKRAAQTDEACHVKVLLAHRPDSCFAAEPEGFDLQLSGHTHAGQFFPWNIFVRLAHKYYRGLNRHGKMWVYVNAGTGYWGPAHRFLVPSEVTLIRLKSIQQGDQHVKSV